MAETKKKKYYCENSLCYSLFSSRSEHEKHSDCLQKLPSKLREKFELKKKLGQGGCGYVFKIFDSFDCQKKALKIIKMLDSQGINELKIEIGKLRNLNHKNIVKYYETKKLGSHSLFILMELCDKDLETMIDNDELDTFEKKMDVFFQICEGIQYLHNEEKIIHRDLKPANILLKKGKVKITDYGTSKSIDQRSISRSLKGTIRYMPPELLEILKEDVGKKIVASTNHDIWSLGKIAEKIFGKEENNPLISEVLKGCLRNEPQKRWNINEIIKFLSKRDVLYYCEKKNCQSLFSSQSEHENHLDCLQKVPSKLRGKFEFIKKLGHGGFGFVFEILDSEDGKKKALKLIKMIENEEINDQEVEIVKLRDLHHQNIVKYYRTKKLGSQSWYILMELCDNDLETMIAKNELDTFEKKMEVLVQICAGIQYLHNEEKIIHRDLKPANILFKNGNVRITDYGTSKSIDQHYISTNLKGTLSYMPPELLEILKQGDDKKIVASTNHDIWSLGKIIEKMFGKEINNPLICEVMKGCLQKEQKNRWKINEIILFLSKKEIPAIIKPSPAPVHDPVPFGIPSFVAVIAPTSLSDIKPGPKAEPDLEKSSFSQLVNPFIFSHQSELYKEMAIIKLDEKIFSTLNKLEVVSGKFISFDGSWTVKKAFDKETNNSVSVKYYKTIEEDFLGLMQQMPAREIHLLQAIHKIGNPILIKFLGVRRDLKPEKSFKLVILMENIEDSLENLRRVGFHGNQSELLYIMNDLVDQLVLLQQNGIACRDIKLTTIAVIKTENNKYCFKIFDFSTGCLVESDDNYLMPIHGNVMGCTEYYASPETMIISQITQGFREKYFQDYYDPFLSDVYSLAKNIERLIDKTKEFAELNEILTMMLIENIEARINFFQLQEILKSPKFQKLMSPPLGLENYIERSQAMLNFVPPPDFPDLIRNQMLQRPNCPTQ